MLVNIYQNCTLLYTDELQKCFLMSLRVFLTIPTASYNELVLIGDFNIHTNNKSDSIVKDFIEMHKNYNLLQLTNEPTYDKKNLLDILITNSVENRNSKLV